MVRNFIAVLLGLLIALVVITFGITLNPQWIEYDYNSLPYEHWNRVVKTAARGSQRTNFFIALLVSCGVGAMVGGLITAIIVKTAKKAYAVFVGFILFIIAMLDIVFTPYHPTAYEIAVMPVLFFFSWLGGLCTDLVMNKLFKS